MRLSILFIRFFNLFQSSHPKNRINLYQSSNTQPPTLNTPCFNLFKSREIGKNPYFKYRKSTEVV